VLVHCTHIRQHWDEVSGEVKTEAEPATHVSLGLLLGKKEANEQQVITWLDV